MKLQKPRAYDKDETMKKIMKIAKEQVGEHRDGRGKRKQPYSKEKPAMGIKRSGTVLRGV